MEKAYILRNPVYEYAFDLIATIENQYGLKPILWFTDQDTYFYQRHRLPYKDKWFDRIFFAGDHEIDLLIKKVSERFEICAALPYEESAVVATAEILEKLNLPGPNPHTIRLFRDKFRLKEYLVSQDPSLPLHTFFHVSSYADLMEKRDRWPDRFVIKPVDGVANKGNGFFSCHTPLAELEAFFRDNSFHEFILEEFLEGTEYAVNGQMDEHGEALIYSIFRYERVSANGRATLYFRDWLTHEDNPTFAKLAAYARQVMKASGLKRSPFHMELMMRGEQPYLLEVGARLAGGNLIYATHTAHGPDLNVFLMSAHYYLNKDGTAPTRCNWEHYNRCTYSMITGVNTTQVGRLIRLEGIEKVKALPEFRMWFKEPHIGDRIKLTVDGESAPFALHLSSERADTKMLFLTDQVRSWIQLKTKVSLPEKLWFHAKDCSFRIYNKLRILWLKFYFRTRLLPS